MADEQVVTTTADTAEQPADTGQTPAEGVQETQENTQQMQSDKEKARIKNALSNLQKRNEELKAKLSAYEQPSETKDLVPDEDGTVEFKGANVPADLAKELMDLRAAVSEVATTSNQKEISQIDQQIAEAEQSFQQAFIGDVVSARKSAFPNIPDEQAQFVDKLMVMSANQKVGEQTSAGVDLFDIDFSGVISSVLSDFKSTVGSLAEQQIADNNNYRQTSAPKSNGMGGVTAPKPVSQMSRQERAAYSRELERIATERTGR